MKIQASEFFFERGTDARQNSEGSIQLGHTARIASASTSAPLGREATPRAARAG